jgi:hypothetical protein
VVLRHRDIFTFTIFRVIKSRRMREAGHVSSMGQMRVAYIIFIGTPQKKRHVGDLRVGGG